MPFFDTVWYVNAGDQATTGYYAVPKRPQNAAVAVGQLVRQFTTPAVHQERVYVCVVAGTTANVTDATWAIGQGSRTVDGTVTWQNVTGVAAVNGDSTNTPNWNTVKGLSISVGTTIKRNSGTSYHIWAGAVSATAGSGAEPAFSDTAGSTVVDGGVTWTCIGPVGNFTGGMAPYARLGALSSTYGLAAGHTIYIGNNHAEFTAAFIVLGPPGSTSGAIVKVLCHDAAGPYPPTTTTTGAVVSTTNAAGYYIQITIAGSFYVEGVTFRAGSTSTTTGNLALSSSGASTNQAWHYYKNCSFQLSSTAATNTYIVVLPTAAGFNSITFDNCTLKFAAATQYIHFVNGQFTWKNTGLVLEAGSIIPTNFINFSAVASHDVVLEALDLSQIAGSIISFPAPTSGSAMGSCMIKDCKLNSTSTTATPLTTGYTVQLVRSSA